MTSSSVSSPIVSLPMYEWPELRAEVDDQWQRLRPLLLDAGIDVPERLARANAELPAVPGGIRDAAGELIAPDPATLPGDGFDLHTLWRHPSLLLAQTCWGPLEHGLAEHVVVVCQPSYDGIEGGDGDLYSSAILMRGRSAVPAPAGASAILPVETLRGQRLAFNSFDSMSGLMGLSRDLEAAGESLDLFAELVETGAHRQSIRAVAEGRADVCAIDSRTWDMARRFEPAAREVGPVGWTSRRLGLPFVTARTTPAAIVSKLKAVLSSD